MAEEIDLLKLVCQRLEDVGIAYMLTGSLAANFYAVPRMTRDIDIVIEIDRFEIGKFCQRFESDLQLRDVKNLLASIKNLDEKYIGNWVQKLELNTVYERAKT